MALPTGISTNVAIDIWRNANLANPTPDVSNVPGILTEAFLEGRAVAMVPGVAAGFTHVLLVDSGTDIRDGYDGTYGNNPDYASIPSGASPANYTLFIVIMVEGKGTTTANNGAAYFKVYLDRITPEWPTNNV
jgi:hypothetical protein